ncbi:hypothetical protein GF718_14605 [Citrobacter braakii]|uniref:hypothetical protein n=1 Tax=Citrobacter braakii TaxID=57706 RepID=UPI00193D8132|nr:hypothetical protein [Citrobacter braakii]ELN4155508.1 hypothetical protein [Citrobacter braakii]MBM3062555.1 hypothetical protein [Citrobacter braakii]MBM3067089.1 hypothetical protein [Citrobacter braakii]WBU71622.1 hypothetical protein PGH06_15265 [Citrobacter braakii]HEE9876615.1 hypothetical protein [Citrobacter braakii]
MFLVATLSSKENELYECKLSVSAQTYKAEQIIFEGYDNVTAHRKVYTLFNEADEKYKYLCKLDADMRFNDSSVLKDIYIFFEKNKSIDHVIIPVFDYFTGKHILGAHFFRKGVKWSLSNDSMFVDPNPTICKGMVVLHKWRNRIDHCFSPSVAQSFLFGVHRAAKMIEAKKKGDFSQFYSQMMVLEQLKKEYYKTGKKSNKLAMIGVICLFEKLINHEDYSNKIYFEDQEFILPMDFDAEKYNLFMKQEIMSLSVKQFLQLSVRRLIHFTKMTMYGYM